MERRRRVYPVQRSKNGWLSGLLLFLSAIVILSGLVWRGGETELSIEPEATSSPIPLSESFDETPSQAEITLPGSEWYALQLGAFENETAAVELGEKYTRRGAAGYVWLDGRYRTLAAVYTLREDAQTVRRQLSEKHEVETYLYQISLPSIKLRLSGMKGQLEILEAAFMHAEDLVHSLVKMSSAMDRQEMSVPEAIEALHGIGDQLQMVSLRLQQRFTSPRHRTVSSLIGYFEDYSGFITRLDPDESAVNVGTKLKYQTFSSLELLKQIYDSLSNT